MATLSTLHIAEYNHSGRDDAPVAPPVREQPFINFSGGMAQQSAAFGGDTKYIEVSTTANCYVKVGGTNPIATTNSQYFLAGQYRRYVVVPGDKLSVLLAASSSPTPSKDAQPLGMP